MVAFLFVSGQVNPNPNPNPNPNFLFVSGQCAVMAGEYWLKVWCEASDQAESRYFWVFFGLCVGAALIGLARSLVFFAVSIAASSTLHDAALKALPSFH